MLLGQARPRATLVNSVKSMGQEVAEESLLMSIHRRVKSLILVLTRKSVIVQLGRVTVTI